MRDKEPERGDQLGYAFDMKCSATLTRRVTKQARSDLASRQETNLREKTRVLMFQIGMS